MRGYDVIHELYQGNLHPCDRGFRSDTEFAITMEAFTAHEKWLLSLSYKSLRGAMVETAAPNFYFRLFLCFSRQAGEQK